ncbi:CBS domain-containing protein [Rhodococcus antarcticus]|uniref:CBS domain-containing protein n=1 Tax=Rhodococcus antarcticus TaxID=2987751 RepID=A0ABY6P589_9NOCA|nr:CBS domain-containing protein [Rhodococcus antarcticus]UZJ26243.1 CBS domain-containing protein [Rhodococcus antarcticus]
MIPSGATVREVAVTAPKTLPADTTVGEVRAAFTDAHVHVVLLVDTTRRTSDRRPLTLLLGTLLRSDLPDGAAGSSAALGLATLAGRTVDPATPALDAHRRLVATGQRRLAVVGPRRELVGLLCLRADGSSFCTDAGVAARECDRAAAAGRG